MAREHYWNRPLSRRRALRGAGAAGVGIAGLALVGCGDDDDSPESSPGAGGGGGGQATPGGTPAGTPTAATGDVEGKPGGQVGVAAATGLANFNVVTNWIEANYGTGIHVYDRLLSSRLHDPGYILEAAESVELVDETTVNFKLKEGLVYQDREPVNGRPVETEDIAVMQQYVRDEPAAQDKSFQTIYLDSVETPDERTVIYHLTQPSAYLFSGTQLGHCVSQCIVPRELTTGDLNTMEPVGSGPYQMGPYQFEVRFEYERNPTYRDAPLPYIDRHIWLGIGNADNAALEAAFRSEQTTFWNAPQSPEIVDRLIDDLGDELLVEEFTSLSQITRNMSNAREYFNDIRVREAFYRWFDPQPYIDLAANGWGVKCPGQLSAGHEAYQLEFSETEEYLRYDPQEARQLLEAAGWDFDRTYELTATQSTLHESIVQIFETQLREVGMSNFTYKILPFADWAPNITKTGNYDFNCVTYSALDTPQTPLRLNHTNSNNINDSWALNDPEIDALIEESERLVDREANIAKVKEVQLELLKRYSHASQIYTPIVRPVQWAYLKNWWEGSGAKTWLVHTNYQTRAWIDK